MGTAYITGILDRLLRPRHVKLIVPIDMLEDAAGVPDGGPISEACGHVAAAARAYRGLFKPKYTVVYVGSQDAANNAEQNCCDPGCDQGKSDQIAGENRPFNFEELTALPPGHCLVRMERPHANPDARKARGNDGTVLPITRDAREQSGGGSTSECVPPAEIFPDSRNFHSANSAATQL